MIPIAVCQRTFPEVTFFDFLKPFNDAAITMFSFLPLPQNTGMDFTLIFVSIPWVIYIMLAGGLMNLLDSLTHKIDEEVTTYRKKKIQEHTAKQQLEETEKLQKKVFSYLALNIVFSKFTITSLSEKEIQEKKEAIKQEVISVLNPAKSKVIDDEEFDDENTFAVLFYTQEDALNYIIKVREQVKLLDNDMQEYGYSIGYKAMLDVQTPEAIRFYILEFLERALNAVELNETCATSDFAARYETLSGVTNVEFISKGNYSINKEKVELKRLEY